jgi:hypothetical protein
LADKESIALNMLYGARVLTLLGALDAPSPSVPSPGAARESGGLLAEEERRLLRDAQVRARRRYGLVPEVSGSADAALRMPEKAGSRVRASWDEPGDQRAGSSRLRGAAGERRASEVGEPVADVMRPELGGEHARVSSRGG